ncbi:MAG TPA: sigma-70 family RNA polymerase sigma factor [Actinomycetota bacterium]|nr:sigma-70 family RNA polymerase sigma factor [Actinomycetota bacterium]
MEGRPLVPTEDESELIERARGGEVGAYEELVRRYQGIAGRTASFVLGTSGEVEDAVQEGFVKAYRALDRFRPGAPFRPWLLRIVANEARNRRKAAGRRAALVLRAAQDRRSGDAAPSPESAVVDDEERRALVAALNELREDDRLVLAYRYFLELSEEEMAVALGVARGTVKSRLSRAMRRLRGAVTAGTEGTER